MSPQTADHLSRGVLQSVVSVYVCVCVCIPGTPWKRPRPTRAVATSKKDIANPLYVTW